MSEPSIEIATDDMVGWVRVYRKHGSPSPNLAMELAQALQAWRSHHSHLHIQCVTAIPRGGDDLELHGWYLPTESAPTSSPDQGSVSYFCYDANGRRIADGVDANERPDDDEPDDPQVLGPN